VTSSALGTLTIVALFGLLVIFEAVLRRWSGVPLVSLKKRPTSFASHRAVGIGSWNLSNEVMRSRDLNFSDKHWDEMTRWNSLKASEWWQPYPDGPKLFRFVNSDFSGTEFGIRNGLRLTRWQPDPASKRIFCLGGSTTFCMEVADDRTWSSVLQGVVNRFDAPERCRVENFGIPGTPGLERVATFRNALRMFRGDIAVFLFGDNDAGWRMYGSRKGDVHDNLPFYMRQLLRRVATRSEVAGWLYGEISPRYLRRLAIEMANTTIAAAEQAHEFAKAKGARVLFVLQPNIFTLRNPDSWDRKIMAGTARDLSVLLEAAYGRYREWIATCDFAVDATNLFDNESPSPYMGDWAHVNTRGNQLIGEFVYKELKSRGWLSETTSV